MLHLYSNAASHDLGDRARPRTQRARDFYAPAQSVVHSDKRARTSFRLHSADATSLLLRSIELASRGAAPPKVASHACAQAQAELTEAPAAAAATGQPQRCTFPTGSTFPNCHLVMRCLRAAW
eukprot:1804183-Pleurochrysis_carterae.AAC.2